MEKDERDQELHVDLGPDGLPVAHVPSACMWGLVEYLSFQRVSVTYHFAHEHFDVVFPKSDLPTAQRLLKDWMHARENAPEEHHPTAT